MKGKDASPGRKQVITVIISIFSVLLILLVSFYMIIHSYINKMNLVSNPNAVTNNKVAAATKEEETSGAYREESYFAEVKAEEGSGEADSPESDINTADNNISNNISKSDQDTKKTKDIFNILLIGIDTRSDGSTGRSDAMMLVSINKETKKITVTSIMRDIYLKIPGYKNNRINAAYAFGGADLLMDTINKNFKLQIDRYAYVNFFSFMGLVDAVDGVTLEVTDEEIPVINGYVNELNQLTGLSEGTDCLTKSGTLLLNGKQALGYARNRYVGNSDFERTARQRRVLEQVYTKMKKLDLVEMNNLLDKILPEVTTNLEEKEMFSLILGVPNYLKYDVEQFRIPMDNTYQSLRIRGMAVLGIDFDKNINELHNKIYDTN